MPYTATKEMEYIVGPFKHNDLHHTKLFRADKGLCVQNVRTTVHPLPRELLRISQKKVLLMEHELLLHRW